MSKTSKLGTSPIEAQRVAAAIVRYRKDFRAFAREQLKINGQPLHLWPCQEPLLQSVEQQMKTQGFVRSIWLKARQVGASTLVEALVAWRTMLWPNTNAIVIADQATRSETLFGIAKSFYESMDEDIRPYGRYVTKRQLVFENPSRISGYKDPGLRSRIVVDSAHKKNIAIGARWDVGHLSEAARFPDPSFVMDGVIPAVHRVPGTMLIIESSAEKAGRWFRDFAEASKRGETGFDFQFVPWYLQPEYYICPVCQKVFPDSCQSPMHELEAEKYMKLEGEERHIMTEFHLGYGHILWMRTKLAEMGNDWDLFRQSFPLTDDDAWVQLGVQAFPAKVLRELKGQVCPPIRMCEVLPGPIMADVPGGRLRVWEEPKVGKAYDIGVDVSQGVGRDDAVELLETDSPVDWSLACVLERGSNRQVAEWASRAMDPVELATTLYWLGKYYLDAQVAVETNGIGGITNQQLAKLGYFNQYIWRYRDEVVPRYSKKTGWETNSKSKPWLVGFATHELMNGRVQIRSERLLKEMETYVRKDLNEWGAVAGRHDDAVMSWMIALLVSDDENFERYFGLRKTIEGKGVNTAIEQPRVPELWECDSTFKKKMNEKITEPWD